MTELEMLKQETYNYLFLQLGYDNEVAKKTIDSFDRITGYTFRNGKCEPSRVITKDGTEIYL